MTGKSARFTPLEKTLSMLLIAGLIGFGFYIAMKGDSDKKTVPKGEGPEKFESETPRISDAATVTEYKYSPADRLPEVELESQYRWDPKRKILRFSYNVWPGWLPVIAANHGTRPNPDSIFYRKYGFRVEMVLMDNPIAARKAFAAGEIHTLWGTVDMMVLLAADLMKDSRTAPRIVQQIDWSTGGDGIAVRRPIKFIRNLRGKTVALAQFSPSEYYLTLRLLSAGLRPADLSLRYTATVFEAAAALGADKDVDACTSWAPDLYKIPSRVAGTRILSEPNAAANLISDVYAVRADFARDHPEIVDGLIAGIFDGMDYVKKSPEHGARWMADAFGMESEGVMDMRRDAHPTNFAENIQFFLNSSNPINFERTWKNASYLYSELGRIPSSIPFDQVVDFTFLQKLKEKGAFAHQKDESITGFTPAGFRRVSAESPMLTQAVQIRYYPNSANPYESARDEYGKELIGKLYDPNINATLERVAYLAGQLDRAIILIEGHADSSMKGRVPIHAVLELSLSRAEAIQRALMDKFRFDSSIVNIEIKGRGWDVPADSNDPDNQALNRRVEISVFPPQQ